MVHDDEAMRGCERVARVELATDVGERLGVRRHLQRRRLHGNELLRERNRVGLDLQRLDEREEVLRHVEVRIVMDAMGEVLAAIEPFTVVVVKPDARRRPGE